MVRVRQGFKCWCCGVLKDEETLYVNKIVELKKVIRAEVSRQRNLNTGYGMLMFSDEQVVKDFKHLGKY